MILKTLKMMICRLKKIERLANDLTIDVGDL
jgi:hypothetical protein